MKANEIEFTMPNLNPAIADTSIEYVYAFPFSGSELPVALKDTLKRMALEEIAKNSTIGRILPEECVHHIVYHIDAFCFQNRIERVKVAADVYADYGKLISARQFDYAFFVLDGGTFGCY